MLEVNPIVHLIVLAGALRVGNLVVLVVLLDQVLKDASGLEEPDFLTVGKGIRESGDTSIGIDLEEPANKGFQFSL